MKRQSPFWRAGRDLAQAAEIALEYRDLMDATRGYYVFREGGRFGSHSSHDAFDDESQP
jgi:hypothetical protein